MRAVPEEPTVTLSTSMAFFIGAGFVEWLSDRLNLPPVSLRISVRLWGRTSYWCIYDRTMSIRSMTALSVVVSLGWGSLRIHTPHKHWLFVACEHIPRSSGDKVPCGTDRRSAGTQG